MNNRYGQQTIQPPYIPSSSSQLSLVISTKDGTRQSRLLTKPKINIGSNPNPEPDTDTIIIDEKGVSNEHLKLQWNENGWYELWYCGSANGIKYQGELLKTKNNNSNKGELIKPIIPKHGDVFHIMENRQIYVTLAFYERKEQDGINASSLKKTIKKKKGILKRESELVLDNISLAIPPRKFIAIVGGSGAGKSTLLNALNGTRPADSGELLYNGNNYYESIAEFNTQIGYVPQDDIVHRDLTVERALYYGAKLRPLTQESIDTRVVNVLASLELTEYRTKLIKELSGGQRKRVSIALELLAEPEVLFLDEITSGLDPALDFKLMKKLRILADKGHTVILVSHAIENIKLCDYVCFLDKGRLVYFGNPAQTLLFFAKFFKDYKKDKGEDFREINNFADIYRYLDEAELNPSAATISNPSSSQKTKSIAEEAREAFRQTNEFKQYCVSKQYSSNGSRTTPTGQIKRRNPWKQFAFLTLRYIELFKNDRRNLLFLMLQPLVIAAILICFMKSGIGTSGFEPTNVVQCPRTAQVFTKDGYVDIPLLAPGIASPASMPVSFSCSDLEHYLQKNQIGQRYAAKHGGTMKALQNFISPGPGDAPTILFIMAFAAIMFGCVNAVREIVKETAIYEREHTIGIGILPYLFSKIVVLGVLCLIQSAILVGIVQCIDPFPGNLLSGMGEIYFTISLTSLAGLMMGLLVSAIVTNNELATSLIPLLLLPQVIFSGTLFPLTSQYPILQWMGAIFPIRWSMAALGSLVGLHSDKINGDQLFSNIYIYQGTVYSTNRPTDAIEYLHHMWIALGIMIVIFIGITFIFLLLKGWRTWRITYMLMQWNHKRRLGGSSSIQTSLMPISTIPQTQLCSRCGNPISLNVKFCGKCGDRK